MWGPSRMTAPPQKVWVKCWLSIVHPSEGVGNLSLLIRRRRQPRGVRAIIPAVRGHAVADPEAVGRCRRRRPRRLTFVDAPVEGRTGPNRACERRHRWDPRHGVDVGLDDRRALADVEHRLGWDIVGCSCIRIRDDGLGRIGPVTGYRRTGSDALCGQWIDRTSKSRILKTSVVAGEHQEYS